MVAPSYKGETEIIECPWCKNDQKLPHKPFRNMCANFDHSENGESVAKPSACANTPTECTVCGAAVHWDSKEIVRDGDDEYDRR